MESANILVCEDERIIARDIEAALSRHGYNVVGIASNGEEAIRIAKEKLPDIALMDVRLKGPLTGIDVAGTLVDQLGIPSIFLTAYADDETLSEAKATQPLSYLVKPFNEVELKAVLEVALHRYREQRHVIGAMQSFIDEHCATDAVERAVEREREFLRVEELESQFRVASNIAEQLMQHLDLFAQQVEPVAIDVNLPQELRNCLHGALVHQKRATEIVNRLLECGEHGELLLEEMRLDHLVRQAARETQRRIGRELEFVECFSPLPLSSVVDAGKMEEVLVDLYTNAYQSSPEDPLVIVTTSFGFEELPERFNPTAPPGWYNIIEITDFGRGIQEEHLEHVFEPCYRSAHNPFSHGLGLTLAYAVLQRHCGWITLRSAPGAGTTVALYLPSLRAPDET